MAKTIIAFCGPAGCGKTAAANYLIDHHGYIRLAFASPLKQMLRTLVEMQGATKQESFKMMFEDLKDVPTYYLAGRTPRFAMQTLGSEWRDLMDRNLWTKIWLNATEFVPKIVVDDLRFTHEAATVHELGGKIIHIEREGFGPGAHTSENDYLNVVPDYYIGNNGDLEHLHMTLYDAIPTLEGNRNASQT